jgi:hypothetical protein
VCAGMVRSLEAIARRAAKRGRSESEQAEIDGRNSASKKRKEPDEVSTEQAKSDGSPETGRKRSAQPAAKKSDWRATIMTPDSAKSRAVSHWGVAQAPDEKLEENRKLREQYKADKDSMAPEERVRAEVLIARDERKRLAKETARKKTWK